MSRRALHYKAAVIHKMDQRDALALGALDVILIGHYIHLALRASYYHQGRAFMVVGLKIVVVLVAFNGHR